MRKIVVMPLSSRGPPARLVRFRQTFVIYSHGQESGVPLRPACEPACSRERPIIRLGFPGLCRPGALIYGRWFVVGGRRVTPLKEALTALADVLAKRPPEEILFDWFRSGRLVGELSVLIKRRHPEVLASQ